MKSVLSVGRNLIRDYEEKHEGGFAGTGMEPDGRRHIEEHKRPKAWDLKKDEEKRGTRYQGCGVEVGVEEIPLVDFYRADIEFIEKYLAKYT